MKGNKYADKASTNRPGKTASGSGNGKVGAAIAKAPALLSHKQKRMAKKLSKRQKREEKSEEEDIPPMPSVGDSGQPWDFRQAVVVESGPKKKKKKKKNGQQEGEMGAAVTNASPSMPAMTSVKTCPEGHALQVFRTPHDEFFCELCGDDRYLPVGSMLFGCRECDWDACEEHTHADVRKGELAREQQMNAPTKKSKLKKEGVWKVLRGADKYKNEYMYLRHDGSKVLLELAAHSSAIFTFRPGAGESARLCSEAGNVSSFQLTLPNVVKRLDEGEGKAVSKKMQLGNWQVVALEDGAAVALNDATFIKTSKHKDGEGPQGLLESQGLELHLTSTGELIWIAPETQVSAR